MQLTKHVNFGSDAAAAAAAAAAGDVNRLVVVQVNVLVRSLMPSNSPSSHIVL